MDESEIKILKVKDDLHREISSDKNMIDFYMRDKAKGLKKKLINCPQNENNDVVVNIDLYKELSSFLRDLSEDKYDNMHEYIGKYIESKKIKVEILNKLR